MSADPIKFECVQIYRIVFGNPAQSDDELLAMFDQQEPSVQEGWKRLAKFFNSVTTPQTLEHIMKDWR